MVTLSEDVLEANELTGREFRAVKKAPGGPDDVYLTGTVLSHMNTTIHIHDPEVEVDNPSGGTMQVSNGIAWHWSEGVLNAEQTAVFDLHEGMHQGVIDSKEGTGTWSHGDWDDEPCTFLKVDHAPFASMTSSAGDPAAHINVYFTDGSNTHDTVVLGVRNQASSGAHYELVVRGDSLPIWIKTGAWYTIEGKVRKPQATQSGVWHDDASGGTTTTFKLSPRAWLSEHMVGWTLQPDVRWQVFVPITGVDENANTLTVAGDYSSRGGEGTRFRIYAPPGVVTGRKVAGVGTNGAGAGALSRWTSAGSSRHLYAGYRYESPLAGFYIYGSDSTEHRQTGKNFAGQHYTLFRHYDPVLMRFTSPDPAAAPFYNLHHYAGNNPARFAPALDPPEQADAGAGRESCGRLGLMGMETRDPSDLHDTFGVVHWVS